MSRFGLDYALDTIGVVIGAIKILCNISNYSSGEPVPFDGAAPATGDLRIESTSPVDALTAPISYDPNIDDEFYITCTPIDLTNADRFFLLIDTANASNFIRVTYSTSFGDLVLVQAGSVNTAVQSSFHSTVINEGAEYDLGFCSQGVGSAKTMYAYVNGALEGAKIINWTGVTFDKLIYGSNNTELINNPDMFLNKSVSAIIGTTVFNGRLWGENDPNGNKYFSDAVIPVVSTLSDNNPKGAVYPHELNGVPVIWPTDFLVDDRYQIGNTCVTVPAGQEIVTHLTIPVTNNGVVVTHDIL